MLADYTAFVTRMINQYEGPYCWDSGDPGGPTKYGITYIDLAEHRGQKRGTMAHWAPIVHAMTLQEAEDIYASKYARALQFNTLKPGTDVVMFDYGVNSGIGRPIHVAQAMVKQKSSGTLSPAVVNAINQIDANKFVDTMCDERMHYLKNLHTWRKFGHGWTARVTDLRSYAKHLIATSLPPQIIQTPPPLQPPVITELAPDPTVLQRTEHWVDALLHPTGKGVVSMETDPASMPVYLTEEGDNADSLLR
jgi:lysozyme family protein